MNPSRFRINNNLYDELLEFIELALNWAKKAFLIFLAGLIVYLKMMLTFARLSPSSSSSAKAKAAPLSDEMKATRSLRRGNSLAKMMQQERLLMQQQQQQQHPKGTLRRQQKYVWTNEWTNERRSEWMQREAILASENEF